APHRPRPARPARRLLDWRRRRSRRSRLGRLARGCAPTRRVPPRRRVAAVRPDHPHPQHARAERPGDRFRTRRRAAAAQHAPRALPQPRLRGTLQLFHLRQPALLERDHYCAALAERTARPELRPWPLSAGRARAGREL
ncbi:MAG: hypothetical protein AVDCRST_MAG39-2173, partial [uncultured Sphingomonadaceae bacterium]